MKRPLIIRRRDGNGERGVTMALVAIAMVAILAMAALSIDAISLYLVREEAQRAADAGALAGARILSLSGMTGDPTNLDGTWGTAISAATTVATAVAQQNLTAGQAPNIVVTYPNQGGSNSVFGINPQITVKVTRQNLPTFFARIWGNTTNTVAASATAEAFNPSNSGSVNNGSGGGIIPVQPRCVKPWIIPNLDPTLGGHFVSTTNGAISNPGVKQLGGGVIGEQFTLQSACKQGAADCDVSNGNVTTTPTAGFYVPAQVAGASIGMNTWSPSCANTDDFEEAIDGCDQQTKYNCGVSNGMNIDLDIAPVSPTYATGESNSAAECLVNYGPGGQDTLQTGSVATPTYPFQIWAGANNPLVKAGIGINSDDPITTSNSIVSIPIYDSTGVTLINNYQQVTVVGFLQAFINGFDLNGNPQLIVLNVAGCGNATTNTAVNGTSPVPIRLISQ